MKIAIFFFLLSAVSGELFIYNGTDGPCVMLDMEGVFTITAENDKKEVSSASLNISDTKYTVSGMCSPGTSLHEMTITFDKNTAWTLTFMQNDNNTASLEHTFSFNANKLNNIWPPSGDLTFASSGPGLNIPYNGSYLCNAHQVMKLTSNDSVKENFTFSVSLAFSKVHIQAFNIIDGKFSQAKECGQDSATTTAETTTKEITTATTAEHTTPANVTTAEHTTPANFTTAEHTTPANVTTAEHTTPANVTTAEHTTLGNSTSETSPATPKTTVKPTTPSPPIEPPEANKYVVQENDSVCIYFSSIIGLTNLTFGDNESNGQTVFIPFSSNTTADTNINVTGNCSFEFENKTRSNMIIEFNKTWTLSLVFEEDTKASSYSLKEIHFTYFWDSNVNDSLGAVETVHNKTVKNTNITDFLKSSLPGSYKCNSELTTYIDGGISLETKKLQYKAFGKKGSKEDFNEGPVTQCSADSESNSIVPIAVGAALAGLVVIVLIAYLIGRHRSRRAGYESV